MFWHVLMNYLTVVMGECLTYLQNLRAIATGREDIYTPLRGMIGVETGMETRIKILPLNFANIQRLKHRSNNYSIETLIIIRNHQSKRLLWVEIAVIPQHLSKAASRRASQGDARQDVRATTNNRIYDWSHRCSAIHGCSNVLQ